MAINTSGILKSPQGSAIQNAEIIFEQTRTSTEVLAGTKFSVITNQTGNYSSSLGVGTYVFKVRFQDETQYRTVASNVIVTQSMNNYSLNQIIQDQSQLQDVDYNLLQDVIQARDQAAASKQAAQSSQATASTKASEASSSAQAALASKNAAQTSEANALSSKNAAQTSETNAASSQTAAANSQTTATTKASEASSSAQAALTSKNAAQTSQTNAAGSQTAASTSQTTASTKAGEASTSQTNAAASQTTASTKAGEASTSQTNAATSQATATTKAGEASTSQINAAASQATATTKATEAANSTTLAQKWAANPENSAVSGGLYSALHYAAKAAQSAQTASGQLVWRGGWSAQAGSAPPTPSGATQDFYRITQAGTILSVQYEVGDYIHWDNINSIWFKMDGTDSVTSVNGRTGAVVVTKTDVGLSAVNNWGASSQTNDASTTTYATTAGVKAAYDLAATKLAATANAVSATKLVTARMINGTNFDGTANITTQNWGTSRNLTIGETSKAVNGSADVSWTLSEIGAIPATLLPTGSNYQDVVSKLIMVGSDGVQEVGRILDFHAVNSVLDNDVRLTVTNETGAISRGDLEITARTVRVNGSEVYHQGNTSPVALGAVPDTRTVNGKRLNADVALVPQDLGTLTTSEIEALGRKSITINQPAGLVQGKYYPIVVTNYYNDQALYITTRSSGGSDPMNNCSFDGIVRQAGWSDKSSIVDGVFTAYSNSERAIHSIVEPSEQEGVYAIYVEARQFPIALRVQGSQTVQCTGAAISHGTSTFVAQVDNPSDITGSTNKLNMLADFAKGSGRYCGVSLYYHERNKPTPADIGALQAGATAVAATKLETARTIGGVSFDGTANINLPGVNTAGNQSTTGNAATATKLATARTISGVAFDGTANITLTAANVGAIATTGGTATGNITAPDFIQSSAQSTNAASCTRKDYVDSAIAAGDALQVSKTGDTMTGNLTAPTFTGALAGNAATATKLATARQINGTNFDGSGNITTANWGTARTLTIGDAAKSVNGAGNVSWSLAEIGAAAVVNSKIVIPVNSGALGATLKNQKEAGSETDQETWLTDKPDNVTGHKGIGIKTSTGPVYWNGTSARRIYNEDFKPTAADVGALPSGSTAVAATKLETARTIGGVSFDGTANINLPGVNTAGNQSTTGNAATATKLATARNISGVQFDGSADITLSAANVGAAPSGYGLGTYGTSISTILGDNNLRRASGYFQGPNIEGIPTDGHTWKYVFSQAHGNAAGYFGYLAIDFAGSKAWIGAQEGGVQKGPFQLVKQRDRFVAMGASGNDYHQGAIEVNGNGAADTIKPTIGFHQAGLFASSLTLWAAGDFRFHTQGLNSYAGIMTGNVNANDVYIRSDIRLKKNLVKLDGALEKVSQLTAYSYDKKQTFKSTEYDKHEVGLIAQDVEKVLPEAINRVVDSNDEDVEEVLTISNSAITALLVEAIKELKAELDELRRLINGT